MMYRILRSVRPARGWLSGPGPSSAAPWSLFTFENPARYAEPIKAVGTLTKQDDAAVEPGARGGRPTAMGGCPPVPGRPEAAGEGDGPETGTTANRASWP